jgi:aspartyl-tRNA(Asn)/glutamyl-tRNA(Gln) amidotransferase subunit A
MARCAKDAALLYEAMAGIDPLDPATRFSPTSPSRRKGTANLVGLRLAKLPAFELACASEEVVAAYDRSLEELASLGAQIVSQPLPCALAEMAESLGLILASEAYAQLNQLVEDKSLPLDEDVRPRVLAGRGVSARDYLKAQEQRRELGAAFEAYFQDVDALLTPTMKSAAIPIELIDQSTQPSHFTRFVNLIDGCAVTMPNGFSSEGLPIGLQVVCRGFDEETALNVALAYQSLTDWHDRHPTL